MQLSNLLTGLFSSSTDTVISMSDFLICIGVSLLIGLFMAMVYTYKSKYTKSFVITLATLPAVVCMVILMVNGNLGAGVAVAGAFSLVRFRSVPGTAKEISAIFLAMCVGLAMGMGYIGYGVIFAIIISGITVIYNISNIGEIKNTHRTMKITIPEDLDYSGVFDDLFEKYTTECDLVHIKTTNMGSLFKLTYDLNLFKNDIEKDFIDELRCRNGNLEITMTKQVSSSAEL